MLIEIPESEADSQTLLDLLIVMDDSKEILDNRKVLHAIVATTEYYGLRDLIALKLGKAGDDTFLPILIKTIMADFDTRYLSRLVNACSLYDCSEYLWLFSDILMVKNDTSFLEACKVIEGMNKLNDEIVRYTCRKLHLHSNELTKEDHRFPLILGIIDTLESKLSTKNS